MKTPTLRIAIAGAQNTGKTTLLQALRAALPSGIDCREWTQPRQAAEEPATRVLLTGLDLSPPDAGQLAQDADWRAALAQAGYQVVYGQAQTRTRNALHAIARTLTPVDAALARRLLRDEPAVRWQGVCESCGDADCEHRLFSRLLAPSLK